MSEVSKPFLINPYKHHLVTILNFIRVQRKENGKRVIMNVLKKIGNSQMDLYLGNLNIERIIKEIEMELYRKDCADHDQFLNYLAERNGYFTVQLSDNSVWVIREGNEPGRYIHIHPGRYSPKTIRVKALTLKSFIAGAILAPDLGQLDLKSVNEGRVVYLNEQPLRALDSDTGVGRLKWISGEMVNSGKLDIL